MKRFVFRAITWLLILSGAVVYVYFRCHPFAKVPAAADEMIIEIDKTALTDLSMEDVISYFEKNRQDFQLLTDYMLNNAALFTSPSSMTLRKDSNEMDSSAADEGMKQIAARLLREGTIREIDIYNWENRQAHFRSFQKEGVCEQGIWFVGNSGKIPKNNARYNYIEEYQDLGDGWYYYLHYYNLIQNADRYRQIVWNQLNAEERRSVGFDPDKGVVTLADWIEVDFKSDFRDRSFVVRVCYHTDQDGMLGPIVKYLDPGTDQIVGFRARY